MCACVFECACVSVHALTKQIYCKYHKSTVILKGRKFSTSTRLHLANVKENQDTACTWGKAEGVGEKKQLLIHQSHSHKPKLNCKMQLPKMMKSVCLAYLDRETSQVNAINDSHSADGLLVLLHKQIYILISHEPTTML